MHELTLLAPRTTLAIAVSAFNEGELRRAGYARTAVVPPAAMAPTRNGEATNRADEPAGRRQGGRWLCIGRVAPNKGIELALMALLVTHAHYDPAATLRVVGRPVVPAYTRALLRFTRELGIHDAVSFTGQLNDAELVTAMAESDALVMASQHEGFGVPVLEAMSMGLPVVANAAGALPEIVGDGGLLVDASDPYALGGAVARMAADADLRAALGRSAAQRVEALDLPSAGDRTIDLVTSLGT
jgi:glycosyltransferase involved in cell wall biosynthesis